MFTKGRQYYSKKDYLLRAIWCVVNTCLFRYSPRLMYGWRNQILRCMGAKIGKKVRIFPSTSITFPWKLEVGDHSVISWNVTIYNLGKVTIGSGTIISQNSHICAGTHDHSDILFTLLMPPILIGSMVWIAADAFIGPNITISDRALIGARAVVTKNVDENRIVAGNPARQLGYRFPLNQPVA